MFSRRKAPAAPTPHPAEAQLAQSVQTIAFLRDRLRVLYRHARAQNDAISRFIEAEALAEGGVEPIRAAEMQRQGITVADLRRDAVEAIRTIRDTPIPVEQKLAEGAPITAKPPDA
jgi:hypothetical protein